MAKKYLGIVIGFTNQKGGVAKTTSAAALASIFAERGYRVLALDNDPQGHLGVHFGIDSITQKDLPGTTADIYTGKKSAEEIAICSAYNDVWVVAASTDELSPVEMYLPTRQGSDLQLKNRLKTTRQFFDFIFLDAPPNLGKLSINVMAASDWLLVPVEGPLGMRSLDTIIQAMETNTEIYDLPTRLLGVFLTMVDRTRITSSVREEIEERYQDLLLKSEIRRSTLVRESSALQMPIPNYAPDSPVAADYQALATEIISRLGL